MTSRQNEPHKKVTEQARPRAQNAPFSRGEKLFIATEWAVLGALAALLARDLASEILKFHPWTWWALLVVTTGWWLIAFRSDLGGGKAWTTHDVNLSMIVAAVFLHYVINGYAACQLGNERRHGLGTLGPNCIVGAYIKAGLQLGIDIAWGVTYPVYRNPHPGNRFEDS